MRKVYLLSLLLFFLTVQVKNTFAQSSNLSEETPKLNLSGFMDVFYAYDFNKPKTNYRQTFFYNHNRHQELNLNLGYIKASLEHTKYRANFALQAGTYTNDNYISVPGVLKNVFEANIGLSLNKKNNLWLDAGILSSIIGFETAVSSENWTLTRSILAENSPYYLTGAKLSYKPNQQWELVAMLCNGWQRIQKQTGNSLPAISTQIKYTPTEKTTLNWSTFVGTDEPDSTRKMRYFNNFFGQYQLNQKLGIILGFDIGIQQRTINSTKYDVWYSPVMLVRYAFNDRWATACRAEYYNDETGIIIPTNTPNGFKTTGLSLNLDYSANKNLLCRIEGRWLNSEDDIFVEDQTIKNTDFFIVTSIALKFNQLP